MKSSFGISILAEACKLIQDSRETHYSLLPETNQLNWFRIMRFDKPDDVSASSELVSMLPEQLVDYVVPIDVHGRCRDRLLRYGSAKCVWANNRYITDGNMILIVVTQQSCLSASNHNKLDAVICSRGNFSIVYRGRCIERSVSLSPSSPGAHLHLRSSSRPMRSSARTHGRYLRQLSGSLENSGVEGCCRRRARKTAPWHPLQ